MRGTLALVGSGEYLPPMEPVDRWLLQRVPGAPRVVCLPTAAGAEGQARVRYWMDLGVSHFQRLGAQAEGVGVIDRATAEDLDCAERVCMANFVYLSGGNPIYLYDTLAGTAVWGAILDVLNHGGVLAGCSAGAMICGQQATPWGRHPGFNLLPGAAIMPHYDELPDCGEVPVRSANLLKVRLARRATLVGIDGNTALVVRRQQDDEVSPSSSGEINHAVENSDHEHGLNRALHLAVIGAGGVTIWGPFGPVRYSNGDELIWNEKTQVRFLMKRRVLFLCTGNSCRSQLAEAIVNARTGGEWEAFSAGTRPTGYVHPNAVRALAEIGIQHEGRSKPVDEFQGQAFDLVVTVCDSAAEDCPVWLGKGKRAHLSFPDPAKATGSDEEVMAAFRAVRDDIAQRIPALLESGSPTTIRPNGAGA